jgi:hypothetical protein
VAAEDFELPSPSEKELLLAALANLIRRRGAETLLVAPVVLPTLQFFPEPLAPRGQGVVTLLRRMLVYANLGAIGVDLEVDDDLRPLETDEAPSPAHEGAAAWFYEIRDEVAYFGVAERELRDAFALLGTLAHEVAHAYRERHGLRISDHHREEQLTDLTAIYLGFGALVLESSYRFKTGGVGREGVPLLYESTTRGYLRPGQLAYLLGVQLVARNTPETQIRLVAEQLSLNHAELLWRAVSELSDATLDLKHTLGLPAQRFLPVRHNEAPPLPEVEAVVRDLAQLHRTQARQERVVFRVVVYRQSLGAVVGIGVALWLAFATGSAVVTFLGAPLFAVLGYKLGRRIVAARCSNCERHVPRNGEHCAFCDTPLVGDIETLADRLDATEAYLNASRREDARGARE